MKNNIPVYTTKVEKQERKIIPDYRLSNDLLGYSKQQRYANFFEWCLIAAIAIGVLLFKSGSSSGL